ncbi:MAG: HU family DNA-binding protein [Archaeoglobaceae archaeon]
MRHNRQTLAKIIANRVRSKEETVKKILDSFVETVREEIMKGNEVMLKGLGRLYTRKGRVKFKSYIRRRHD